MAATAIPSATDATLTQTPEARAAAGGGGPAMPTGWTSAYVDLSDAAYAVVDPSGIIDNITDTTITFTSNSGNTRGTWATIELASSVDAGYVHDFYLELSEENGVCGIGVGAKQAGGSNVQGLMDVATANSMIHWYASGAGNASTQATANIDNLHTSVVIEGDGDSGPWLSGMGYSPLTATPPNEQLSAVARLQGEAAATGLEAVLRKNSAGTPTYTYKLLHVTRPIHQA